MHKVKAMNTRLSLIFTFCLLILIFLLYGLFSLLDHRVLFNLTQSIHSHPLVVSNVALRSNVCIREMHRRMMDIVHSKSSKGIQESIKAVEREEKMVSLYLDIVKDKIIGAKGKSLEDEARTLFENWRPLRREIINLVIKDQIEQATNMIAEKNQDHVTKLEAKMFELTNYARDKASLLMGDSKNIYSGLNVKSIIFLLMILLISSLIAFYTIKQILFYETGLRNSESRYRSLVETQIDLISRFYPNGTLAYVNDVFCRFFNKTTDNLIGSKWQLLLVDDDFDLIEKKLLSLSAANDSVVIETRVRSGKDKIHWVQFINSGFFNSKGDLLEIQSVGRDITEQKLAKEVLQESEGKYRELADSLPQVTFEIDTAGRIIYINKNAFDLFMYTKEDFEKGLSVFQMIIPEEHDRARKNMLSVLNGNKYGGMEYTALRHDGTTFPALIHSSIITKNSKPAGLRGLLIDISETKKMEADLKRLALAIDHSSDTIMITDTSGFIIYVNPAFEKITGYSKKEAQGKNPRLLQSGKLGKSFYIKLWKTISNGKTWSGRFVNKKKDGSHYMEDARISPVFSSNGEIVNYVAVKRDVTEKLQLEAQLHQAQKMESIGTLAGGIAHDFNNILFPIVGYAEMLLEDAPEDSPFRNSLNKIYNSSLRAKDLVNQILTFSRQETNELKPIKVQSIIKDALKLMRSTIPTTIKIKSYIKTDCGAIKADPTQIHQIVMNLTTNAYHAMEDKGGELKVNFKEIKLGEQDLTELELKPGIYNCLIVADTGVGMDKDLTNKIFNPFFTTKELGKGTGMGLSVVHGIVKNMDGAINVYSEPGKGTEFHVYFPIKKESFENQVIHPKEKILGGKEQILIVDDEEEILAMEKKMLERLGYQVTSFISSIEALEAFSTNPDGFDLIITDMTMPNMSGDKLSTELIKIRSDIPILLCTGFSETVSEKKAASLGIKGLLFKPIIMKDLAQKIREAIDENSN
jgi:PAS domain S-box-containing protein